jgi:hypothetical protein
MTTIDNTRPAVDAGLQRSNFQILNWSGPACILVVLIGWMVMAGFLPPPSPSLSAEQAAAVWQHQTNLKRLGLILCVWGGTLYVTFTMAVMFALRHNERDGGILAKAQAALGVFGTVYFTLNFFILSMTPYRVETNPSSIEPLHDLGFAMTFAPVAPFTFQYLLIALAILQDRSPAPVFPRWTGYVNIMCGLLLVPASLIPMFKTGPLAWNGLFSFWIPVVEFTAWFFVMFLPMRRFPRNDHG